MHEAVFTVLILSTGAGTQINRSWILMHNTSEQGLPDILDTLFFYSIFSYHHIYHSFVTVSHITHLSVLLSYAQITQDPLHAAEVSCHFFMRPEKVSRAFGISVGTLGGRVAWRAGSLSFNLASRLIRPADAGLGTKVNLCSVEVC